MMLFEGMPWPLVLPLAASAMLYAIISSKKEEKEFKRKNKELTDGKEA